MKWLFYVLVCLHLIVVILTSDHNDTDSGILAQLNGASDLLAGRVQHTHAANEGEVSLRRWWGNKENHFIQTLSRTCGFAHVSTTTIIQHSASHLVVGELG